jgi:hypothetical protein
MAPLLEDSANHETVLEAVLPGLPHQFVLVTQSPFLIGRGSETGKPLRLEDQRIARKCAAIVSGEAFSGGESQSDDMTLLFVRYRAAAQQASAAA